MKTFIVIKLYALSVSSPLLSPWSLMDSAFSVLGSMMSSNSNARIPVFMSRVKFKRTGLTVSAIKPPLATGSNLTSVTLLPAWSLMVPAENEM